MRPSNRPAVEERALRGAQTNVNEQTQLLLKLFGSCDTEHRSERDVFQIDKYLQHEYY